MFPGGGRDPFGDPFSAMRQMEQQMDAMMGGMMQRMHHQMGGMMNDPFFGSIGQQHQALPQLQGRPYNPQGGQMHSQSRHQPVIEEITDDDQMRPSQPSSTAQHFVEEPEDVQYSRPAQAQAQANYQRSPNYGQSGAWQTGYPLQPAQMQPFGGFGGFGGLMPDLSMMGPNGGGHSMTFSSSTVSYGGPGGVTYSRQESARTGPGGVREHHVKQYDSRTGQQLQGVSRGVGDRGRTVTRTRYSDGREEHVDQLHNLHEEEAPQFDAEWSQAAQVLPGRGRLGLQSTGQGLPQLPASQGGRNPRTV